MKVYQFNQPDSQLYMIGQLEDFNHLKSALAHDLLEQHPVNRGKWQQLDVSASPMHATHELLNTTLWIPLGTDDLHIEEQIEPDMPWASNHFGERVGGFPVNPGETHTYWPYHKHGADLHISYTTGGIRVVGKYAHNYMERYWPKLLFEDPNYRDVPRGYRFPIGDLDDVVKQLVNETGTRQAYLPVWFPEDTGALDNQRVPCSLGYHFIVKEGALHCTYYLRSCEMYRHFTNDVYLTQMLAWWITQQVFLSTDCKVELSMGQLTMHITSLHSFVGDDNYIKQMVIS